jgi:hypothetical protein
MASRFFGGIEWLSDSRRMLYGSDGIIYLMDSETGSTREVLSAAPARMHDPRLSMDERWMYFQRSISEADIWMLTLDEEQK